MSRATPSNSITWSSVSGSTPRVVARAPSQASISFDRSSIWSPCSVIPGSLYHRRYAEAEEPDLDGRRHRGLPRGAPDPPGDHRGVVADAPRARAPPVEPDQDLLARGGLHQGRPPRVLLQRRAPAAPPPRAPSADDEAHAQRRRWRLLLREDGPVAHAGVDPPVHRALGGRERGPDRLPHGRRPLDAAVRGEPRCDRDAPAAL